jgi:hypothetical protein
MIKVNQHGDTAWDFFVHRFHMEMDHLEEMMQTGKPDKNDEARYWVYQDLIAMIDEVESDFADSLEPDPMLDPQLG